MKFKTNQSSTQNLQPIKTNMPTNASWKWHSRNDLKNRTTFRTIERELLIETGSYGYGTKDRKRGVLSRSAATK
ncbi:hypothetical protein T03_6149 [Trichinella britovi]|uniref:Uncharacterized protein n=1 Tax=Trichinella britovi TaxID=45882 RepID=A0A0V1CEE3_TRIBR|nr:hypothetical protein T03_6149 [Trichinella britovi]